jgi:hypothetical protein
MISINPLPYEFNYYEYNVKRKRIRLFFVSKEYSLSAFIQAREQEPVRRIRWSKINEIHLHGSREKENELELLDLGEQSHLRRIGKQRIYFQYKGHHIFLGEKLTVVVFRTFY